MIPKRMISKPIISKMKSVQQLVCAMLALLVVSLAPATLPAQEQPGPAPSQQQSDGSSHQPGFGRQLSHETREAAGEDKDDKAQFKESPAVKFIAKYTGLSTGSAYLFCVILNFAVIAGIIIWVARKYLPAAFSARTAAIQKAMQEAQKASEEARRKLAEIESRLMKLDVEIGTMRDAAEKDAAAEELRIQDTAREDAHKMLESARQEIAAASKAARRDLTAYAADLAVALAQKQIHVDAATDQSLVRSFAGQLGSSAADAPGKGRQ
jgi:F-type H+-transporting ATPase subunit b